MTVKIFIGNINDGAKSRDLQVLFERFGKVTECDILKNFGFVHMEVEEDAKAAIAALDGHSFAGSKIAVEMSHGKSKRRSFDGPPRGGGSFRPRGYGPPSRSRYPPRDYPPYDRPNGRYPPPPPPRSRYDPYDRRPPHPMDRRPPPPPPSRDYYKDRSPYARPPPDYYRRSPPPRSYYDHYDSARRASAPSHASRSPP